ncbi:MAG: hypothetical protein HY060_22750 [Proteobacteria bacterium]|nr:hypothetical protein [Pseudomonadota bacterium]
MASLSHPSTSRTLPGPARSLAIGGVALVAVLLGLHVMSTEETSFYRTHGMVPDARTAVRLAEMVLADPSHGCVLAERPIARLQDGIWTVEGQPGSGGGPCRVLLDRKDGQILKIESRG